MGRASAGRATRIATTGVATASCLGLVAAMGATGAEESTSGSVAPLETTGQTATTGDGPVDAPTRKVVVVVRRHRAAAPTATATSAAPAAPAPAPAPPPPPAPVPQARSGGS